jgi:hypothetical protein
MPIAARRPRLTFFEDRSAACAAECPGQYWSRRKRQHDCRADMRESESAGDAKPAQHHRKSQTLDTYARPT